MRMLSKLATVLTGISIAVAELPVNQLWAQQNKTDAIPWGAMYVPVDVMKSYGMTGTFGYYRGTAGARKLLVDLETARRFKIRMIVTMGDVKPSVYADSQGRINMEIVKMELAPFVAIAEQLKPFIEDGTIWGIRFMDEPHDPSGLPRGTVINAQDLGNVMAYLKKVFGKVRVGSTAPASYMVNVPDADWCFGQYCHSTMGRHGIKPVAYIEQDASLAKTKGMCYVASLNASTNPVDNKTLFEVYLAFAGLPDVDFLTSWQWPREKYHGSFEQRISDPSVKTLVEEIPRKCERNR